MRTKAQAKKYVSCCVRALNPAKPKPPPRMLRETCPFPQSRADADWTEVKSCTCCRRDVRGEPTDSDRKKAVHGKGNHARTDESVPVRADRQGFAERVAERRPAKSILDSGTAFRLQDGRMLQICSFF